MDRTSAWQRGPFPYSHGPPRDNRPDSRGKRLHGYSSSSRMIFVSTLFTGEVCLLALSSVSMWLMGCFLLYRRVSLYLTAIRTTGKVVGFTEETRSARTAYRARVSFQSLDGVSYEIAPPRPSNRKPEIGELRSVLYRPREPQKGMVENFLDYWLAPFAFFLLASAPSFILLKHFELIQI